MQRVFSVILSLSLYLGLSNGYLALWKEGKSQPEKVFPYHISLYPQTDHKRLEKGIPIGSEAELSKQIEDYLS